jgi:hypothetical protein
MGKENSSNLQPARKFSLPDLILFCLILLFLIFFGQEISRFVSRTVSDFFIDPRQRKVDEAAAAYGALAGALVYAVLVTWLLLTFRKIYPKTKVSDGVLNKENTPERHPAANIRDKASEVVNEETIPEHRSDQDFFNKNFKKETTLKNHPADNFLNNAHSNSGKEIKPVSPQPRTFLDKANEVLKKKETEKPLTPKEPEMPAEEYPNAILAIKYRPEIKSKFDENPDLSDFNKMTILKTLDENPQINGSDFAIFVESVISGNEGPFDNKDYNKVYSALFEFGPQYQEKFLEIHKALGSTFDAELVFEAIKIEYLKEIDSKKLEEKEKILKENPPVDNKMLLKSLPFGRYETNVDIISLSNIHFIKRSKNDNSFNLYNWVQDLIDSIQYDLHDNLWHKDFKVQIINYKNYIIMRIGDREVYASSTNAGRHSRASKKHFTIAAAKNWIDSQNP